LVQLGLFDAGPRRLIDDATGCIEYTPEWLPAALARDWFERLQHDIDWRSERRLMYERELDVPRVMAHFDLRHDSLPAPLPAIVERIRGTHPAPFNSVGLNLYRDRNDSVAPHNDRLQELVPGQPILLLSLGTTRRMVIRAKAPPRRVLNIELEPGSLLEMSYRSQLHYEHGIPKQRDAVGPRILRHAQAKPHQCAEGNMFVVPANAGTQ
jgi:alkylated DNA repair dioxygenase AlkB